MNETNTQNCGDVITTFLPRRSAQIYATTLVKEGIVKAAEMITRITGGNKDWQREMVPFLKKEFAKHGWDYKEPTESDPDKTKAP